MVYGHQLGAAVIYKFNNHDLDFFIISPPALVYVQDPQDNMTGADPTKGLNSYGVGSNIQDISTSFVYQENIGGDAKGGLNAPSPTTGWSINIFDHPAETYTINLLGVATGVCDLSIDALYVNSLDIPKITNQTKILIANGMNKKIQVTFDPTNKVLAINPIINNGDLLQDTQIACSLGDISPTEACEVLESLATEIEKALNDKNTQLEAVELKLYLIILNRLHNWGGEGYRRNWDDLRVRPECTPLRNKDGDHTIFFAKDPSYSALELDVKMLLNALPKKRNHD